jgi:predicted PurR-regulated permease PerM
MPQSSGAGAVHRGPLRAWDARRVLHANLVVLGVAACFLVLYRFAAALFILFAGTALGMAVKPGVERLHQRGLPRWAGALAIYAVLGAAIGGVLALAVPVVVDEGGHLLARVPRQAAELRAQLSSSQSHTLQRLAEALPRSGAAGAGGPGLEAAAIARTGAAILRNGVTLAAVLLLGFYWTLEGDRRMRALALFAPLERRRGLRDFFDDVERSVGAYLRGQSLVCLVIGALAVLVYALIGLPHAVMLGLVYAAGEAVPVLGPIVGTAIAALVALSVAPSLVAWVLVAAVFLQLCENYLLIPRIMDRVVGINPLVTLLAVTGFGSVLGVAGGVLAIPMAAIVQLIVRRWLLDAGSDRPVPEGRDRLSVVRYDVRELVRHLRKRSHGRAHRSAALERLEDVLEGIAFDLDHLLSERGRGP